MGFDAPAMQAPAELPAGSIEAALLPRQMLIEGGQPGAVVLLVEIDAVGAT
jgi:hypothetical protein